MSGRGRGIVEGGRGVVRSGQRGRRGVWGEEEECVLDWASSPYTCGTYYVFSLFLENKKGVFFLLLISCLYLTVLRK